MLVGAHLLFLASILCLHMQQQTCAIQGEFPASYALSFSNPKGSYQKIAHGRYYLTVANPYGTHLITNRHHQAW